MSRALVIASFALTVIFLCACTAPQSNNQNANNRNGGNANGSQAAPEKPAQKAEEPAGQIEVRSTPPGAAVLLISLDEGGAGLPKPRGTTPTTITGVAPGKYSVHLEKPGYRFFQKDVEVGANRSTQVVANLRKQ